MTCMLSLRETNTTEALSVKNLMADVNNVAVTVPGKQRIPIHREKKKKILNQQIFAVLQTFILRKL